MTNELEPRNHLDDELKKEIVAEVSAEVRRVIRSEMGLEPDSIETEMEEPESVTTEARDSGSPAPVPPNRLFFLKIIIVAWALVIATYITLAFILESSYSAIFPPCEGADEWIKTYAWNWLRPYIESDYELPALPGYLEGYARFWDGPVDVDAKCILSTEPNN